MFLRKYNSMIKNDTFKILFNKKKNQNAEDFVSNVTTRTRTSIALYSAVSEMCVLQAFL